MRLYYLEMKRLIRTKSVWILMIAMVVLAAVMAYVPVTFIRAYKTDAGNVQAVTGVQAVKISKETRKDMEGEVTEEKIRQAIRVLNEMYQEYGSSFMEEVPADVYAEKIYPIMPVLNVIEQVLVPDGKNLYNMEAFDVKEEDAATIYEKYREEIQGLSQNPELVKEMQKISGSVKTPFTYESVKAASSANRVMFIKDGEVFHQLYRGNLTDEQMYQKISDTLTVLEAGGERVE